MKIWAKHEESGIEIGINNQGNLFLGDSQSGYNLKDTPQNRKIIISDFERITNQKVENED